MCNLYVGAIRNWEKPSTREGKQPDCSMKMIWLSRKHGPKLTEMQYEALICPYVSMETNKKANPI